MTKRIESLFIDSGLDPIEQREYKGYLLSAPLSFWNTSAVDRHEVINACGPKGFLDRIIPDHLWGLSILPACEVHDWCFAVWSDRAGFKLANKLFKNNMHRIVWDWFISTSRRWYHRFLFKRRRRLAVIYYRAVQDLGEFFYHDL